MTAPAATVELPPWRDDWDPSVQVQWLRTYEMLALAEARK